MAKKEQVPMAPEYAIGQATAQLRNYGFQVVHTTRTTNSMSRYLVWHGSPMKIRIATHRWPRKSKRRRQHPNVLTTILFDRPMTGLEVEKRVSMGVQAFHEAWRRVRVEATSTNPEDMPWRFSANNSSAFVEPTTLCSVSDAAAADCPNPSA